MFQICSEIQNSDKLGNLAGGMGALDSQLSPGLREKTCLDGVGVVWGLG